MGRLQAWERYVRSMGDEVTLMESVDMDCVMAFLMVHEPKPFILFTGMEQMSMELGDLMRLVRERVKEARP